jgi:predicted nucleotidyltransferase
LDLLPISCLTQNGLDKGAVVEIIDRFRQEIQVRGILSQKIILYGPHASGTSAAVSDIDVVIISDDFIGKGYWERIDILTDVICAMSAPLEAVAMTQEEWERGDSFIADFARHREVLCAA